jgi:propanol-preferring alcohol dehydrogenase
MFAPVGTLVPSALAALDRGGCLAIAGIHLSDIPGLNYQKHLFEERMLCSVTANTRRDGIEFLELAARIPVRVSAVPYPMDDANRALVDLAEDRVNGAAVLVNTRPGSAGTRGGARAPEAVKWLVARTSRLRYLRNRSWCR